MQPPDPKLGGFLFNFFLGFFSSDKQELELILHVEISRGMEKEHLIKERKELIEKLGVLMEQLHKMAPVAARIFASIVVTGRHGLSFDQLVNDLNASKSSVSTHLENLQSQNKIIYYTKPGDRKRYFTINPDLMVTAINEMVEKWNAERDIHHQILDYKKKCNSLQLKEEPRFDLEFNKDYLVFLEEATTSIGKLKTKIINKKDLPNNNK